MSLYIKPIGLGLAMLLLTGCGNRLGLLKSSDSNKVNMSDSNKFGLTEGQAKVRVVTSRGPLVEWVDLRQTPTLVQSLRVDGVTAGDTVLLRAASGITNDVATEEPEEGSISYKGENRYDVAIESFIQMDRQSAATGSVVSQSNSVTTAENHHGISVNSGSVVVTDPSLNVFNFVMKGKVEGGPTPERSSERALEGSHDNPPGNVPSVYVEDGSHKTKLDALILSPGWEKEYTKTSVTSDRSHLRELKVTRGEHFVSISVPLGPVKAGEIFDVSTSIVCENDDEYNQLCTHQAHIVDAQDKLWGEEITVKAGKNVTPGETDTLNLIGAHVVTGNYAQAFLTIQTNTMSNTKIDGNVIIGNGSFVNFTRYTPNHGKPVVVVTSQPPTQNNGDSNVDNGNVNKRDNKEVGKRNSKKTKEEKQKEKEEKRQKKEKEREEKRLKKEKEKEEKAKKREEQRREKERKKEEQRLKKEKEKEEKAKKKEEQRREKEKDKEEKEKKRKKK